MNWVIRIVQLASGEPSTYDGMYIKSYIPNPSPRGQLVVTTNQKEAKGFNSKGDAWEFWRQKNGVKPDGQPNHPLVAFTVEIFERTP